MLSRVLLSLVLLLAMGAGSAGRASCAMHGMGSMTSHVMPSHDSGMPGHAMTHHHGQGSSHNEHGDACCCGGECSGVAQVASIPLAATVRVAMVVATPVSAFEPGDHRSPPAEPDRLLPFANGPPATKAV